MGQRRGMAQPAAANGPRGRDIWISSGLRSRASGLRESPAFDRLDLFGIPWILSSEMSLFNGLQATRGQFYFLRGPFPRACVASARRRRSEGRPHKNASPAGRGWASRGFIQFDIARSDRGIGIRLTRPSLFCKELSIWRHLYKNPTRPPVPTRSPDARLFNELWSAAPIQRLNPNPSSLRAEGEAIHAPGRGGGMDCFVPPGSSTRGSLLAMTVAGCLN